jgi:adenosylmethionine-8-amino-7-oxononanoate aminotransferase
MCEIRVAVELLHLPDKPAGVARCLRRRSDEPRLATMTDFIILGTDTDAGKTTFAALWLVGNTISSAYWKPVETGPSDTAALQQLFPDLITVPPAQRFDEPIAPQLAARRQGSAVWSAGQIAAARPHVPGKSLVVESFGGPFSPLNDHELQIELIRRLNLPSILVVSSKLGAIGRTLQALTALSVSGIDPLAVVLLGPHDGFAVEALSKQRDVPPVFALRPPEQWTTSGFSVAAGDQPQELAHLLAALNRRAAPLGASKLTDRDRRAVWHPYTSLREETPPLAVVGAQDEFLHLADGRRIIDGISSWWTILHGHRHPPLMQALQEASREIDHVLFAGATHPWAVELAELLLKTTPWPGGRVFYSDNGSTAVEVALKMAYQYWRLRGQSGRTRFIGFQHGYHGDTFGAMAVSRDPVFFGQFEPLLCQADIVPLDPQALDAHLRGQAHETAAVIVEPLVQGAGGMRMHSPQTLRDLAVIAHQHDVLFIADEVMTGGGRTGTLWAHQQAGVIPDFVCAAKTLGGGVLPLAATLVAPHVVEAFDTDDRSKTFFHGHSFTAHPLACAVAAANWKLLTAGPLSRPREIEEFWNTALAPLKEQRRVKDVRVCGTIAAVEVDAAGGYLADVGRRMRETCLAHGVLLRPLGPVLYALPPWCVSTGSLDQIAAALRAAVERA